MTMLYYIDRFTDETMPCAPEIAAWEIFLSSEDVTDWGAKEPFADGERFTCSVAERFDVTAIWREPENEDEDGEWEFDPPVGYDWCALTFGLGQGWDSDSVSGDVNDILDDCDKNEEQTLAFMQNRPAKLFELRGGKLIEVAPSLAKTEREAT